MPIFEYTCARCLHRFEKVHKADAEAEVICPGCGSSDVKKELSSFSTSTSGPTPSHSCGSGG